MTYKIGKDSDNGNRQIKLEKCNKEKEKNREDNENGQKRLEGKIKSETSKESDLNIFAVVLITCLQSQKTINTKKNWRNQNFLKLLPR